jgi:hypothetical protein
MGFFLDVFGFHELIGKAGGYTQTQQKLLEMATIEQVPSKHAAYFRERCDFKVSHEKSISAGIFSMPSIKDLRQHAHSLMDDIGKECGRITVRNIIGAALHVIYTSAAML